MKNDMEKIWEDALREIWRDGIELDLAAPMWLSGKMDVPRDPPGVVIEIGEQQFLHPFMARGALTVRFIYRVGEEEERGGDREEFLEVVSRLSDWLERALQREGEAPLVEAMRVRGVVLHKLYFVSGGDSRAGEMVWERLWVMGYVAEFLTSP